MSKEYTDKINKSVEHLKMKLNVGCFGDYRKGWVNLDVNLFSVADVYHDLNVYPYPFEDNIFDYICAWQVMEHLNEFYKPLEELWRISKDKAIISIMVPYWHSYTSFMPEHKIFFNTETFQHFKNKDTYHEHHGIHADFNVKSIRLITAESTNHKVFNWLSKKVFEPLCNINLLFSEMFLSKIFPINLIVYELEVIKLLK